MMSTQNSPEAGSSPPVKHLLDESETVAIIGTEYESYLYNVVCLSDEDIWTRGEEITMKLFSINQGSLLKSITTKSGEIPIDIAVTKSGDLVYTDYNDRTVNIVKNEKVVELIRLQIMTDTLLRTKTPNICVSDRGARAVVVVNKAGKLRFMYTGHLLLQGTNHSVQKESPPTVRATSLQLMITITVSTS
ncbi:uncharacterized protein LOC134256575 [Saccostrea cucullata]|uniref:uncharacterized protein LOC134256575 n=1 Tax=Saccostrea cuccullata TaxID=36930 RepID=UPI002ED171E5